MYKPLKVSLLEVVGVSHCMKAMRKPKGGAHLSDTRAGYSGVGTPLNILLGPSDAKVAGRLIRAGDDHGKCMRGVFVYFELEMQVGWKMQFDKYRLGMEDLSTSSSMHGELKLLNGPELAEKKQADLPNKIYHCSMVANYQALRRIYRARKNHRHPDWRIFCKFIESLPWFDKLIMPK